MIDLHKRELRKSQQRDYAVYVAFGLGILWMFGFHCVSYASHVNSTV